MSRWVSIVVLTLFFVPFIMAEQRVDEDSESGESLAISDAVGYTTDGVKALKLFKDNAKAKSLLLKAVESDSEYAPAHYYLSEIYAYNSVDSAYLHSQKAYELDTLNKWYLGSYAQNAALSERFDEAQMLFKRLLKQQPRDVNAYRVLALLYNQQKRHDEAVMLLDSAAVKVGANPYLDGLKRQILISNKEFDRVINEAKAAVEQEPLSIENRLSLAELYRDLNRDSLAIVEYNNALKMDSMNLTTLLSMADFMKRRNNKSEYIKVLRSLFKSDEIDLRSKISIIEELKSDKAFYRSDYIAIGGLITTLIVQNPNNEELIEMQAMHLVAIGMLDEALTMVKGHLDMEPPSEKMYRMVIDMERYKERPDSVAIYLKQAMQKFPENDNLELEWAYTLSSQGQYDEAIGLYEERLVNASDSTKGAMWAVIGDLHHQVAVSDPEDKKLFKKRMKLCFKAYDNALRYNADNAMVLNNYAYFLCEYGGSIEQAAQMAKRAIEADNGNSTFLDTYAWILYKLGDYDEAKVNMRRAISLDTTQNGEIALHYGEILYALGEETMANHYWEKAIEWGMSEEQVAASREAAAALANRRGKSKK